MNTDQERIYTASQLVSGVANVLLEHSEVPDLITTFDLLECVDRLDAALCLIRAGNGATR